MNNSSYSAKQFETERKELISILRQRGISDEAVLNVMREIPRHLFVQEVFFQRAYEDSALPISCHQTISQPFTVAFMTQALMIQKGEKVMEIGTGSGYQACILAKLGARVFTIERHFDLLEEARERFEALGCNIASKVGDGSVGWSQFAPYDKIIVTAGAPEVPNSLVQQLADRGIMVVPVGSENNQTMVIVERRGDELFRKNVDGFKFVPLIGKEGWKK